MTETECRMQAGPSVHAKATEERFFGLQGSWTARPMVHAVDN